MVLLSWFGKYFIDGGTSPVYRFDIVTDVVPSDLVYSGSPSLEGTLESSENGTELLE